MRTQECRRPVSRFLLLAILASFGLFLISCSTKAKENHIKRGEEFLQKRKFQEASMEFRAAIDIDNDSAEAHWGLARSFENLGKFSETVESLRRVVDLQPDNLDAKVKLGNYLLAYIPPQLDETDRVLQAVFARDPNFIEGHILKASLFSAQGKSEPEVLDVLKHAISLNPNRTESYVSLSRFFVKISKIPQAEEAVKKGISVNPNSAIGYLEYARFLKYDKRFNEAEAQFLKAVEVEPKNIEALDSTALFYVGQKQLEKAEKIYKELVQVEENSPESRMALGSFYAATSRNNEAVETFSGIIDEFPEYVRARYSLGDIYLERKETAKVTEQIEALLAINDLDYDALILRIRLSLHENRADDAVKDLEEILKNKPSRKDALFYMAQAQAELGRIEQARAFIGDLAKYHPNFLRVNLLKIQASLALGESELALRQSNELVQVLNETAPNSENSQESLDDLKIRALSARGLANLQLGKVEIAQKDLSAVANFSPDSVAALVNLARIYVAQKNLTEALNLYERALAIDGGDFDALSGAVNVLIRQKQGALAQSKIDPVILENRNFNYMLAALHYLKADVYLSEKNLESAENELKQSIELDENYLPAYSAYATLLIERNQTEAAIEQFKKVVEKKRSASVYTLIGILEDSRSNAIEAEKNYRSALEIEPESPIAANNLAWLLASSKTNLDEALQFARASVNQDPNNAGYYDTLGYVYHQKGLHSSAIENYRKAVSLDEAEAVRNGMSPNSEYKERLTLAISSARKPSV